MTNLVVTMPEASLTSLWQRTISFSADGNGASSWLCKEANKMLSEIEKELHETDLKVKPLIRKGDPLREILKVESEEDVSALVIGSHGRIPELRVLV